MRAINPLVKLELHEAAFDASNARQLVEAYDIVIDGTDNFPTRYLVNDACVMTGTPNIYGSIFRFEGQATVFAYEGGPCYRCLYPEPPPPGLVLYPEASRHSPITTAGVARLQAIASTAAQQSAVFAKVGDSITVDPAFLACFDGGRS